MSAQRCLSLKNSARKGACEPRGRRKRLLLISSAAGCLLSRIGVLSLLSPLELERRFSFSAVRVRAVKCIAGFTNLFIHERGSDAFVIIICRQGQFVCSMMLSAADRFSTIVVFEFCGSRDKGLNKPLNYV